LAGSAKATVVEFFGLEPGASALLEILLVEEAANVPL
jgi:hypothetical protein